MTPNVTTFQPAGDKSLQTFAVANADCKNRSGELPESKLCLMLVGTALRDFEPLHPLRTRPRPGEPSAVLPRQGSARVQAKLIVNRLRLGPGEIFRKSGSFPERIVLSAVSEIHRFVFALADSRKPSSALQWNGGHTDRCSRRRAYPRQDCAALSARRANCRQPLRQAPS